MLGMPGHSVIYSCLLLPFLLLPDGFAGMSTGPFPHIKGLGLEIIQVGIGMLKNWKCRVACSL